MIISNGKEQQEQTLYYDYGFRQLDAQLGRWHVIDAMAEKYFSESPYSYAGNDPVNKYDVMGLQYYRKKEERQTETHFSGGGIMYSINYWNNRMGFNLSGHFVTIVTETWEDVWEADKEGNHINFLGTQKVSESSRTVWVWDDAQTDNFTSTFPDEVDPPDKPKYKRLAKLIKYSPVMFIPAFPFVTTNPFLGADAIAGDLGAITLGQEYDQGAIFILSGKNAGEIYPVTEEAYGFGTDTGFGAEIVRMDLIKGDKNALKLKDFLGRRYKGAAGAEIYGIISAGLTVGMSFPRNNEWKMLTTGIQVGAGASFLGGAYINFNVGTIKLFP